MPSEKENSTRLQTHRAGSKLKNLALNFTGNIKWPHTSFNIKHERAEENMSIYYPRCFLHLFLPSFSYSKFDIIKIRVTFLPIFSHLALPIIGSNSLKLRRI